MEESQRLGFLGSRPIIEVVAHARHFVEALDDVHTQNAPTTFRVLDLGSGGGVPGLVIAHDVPTSFVTLLDRRRTRTDHLSRVVRRLDWERRVEVLTTDATRPDQLRRESFDCVVARGFGPPQFTLMTALQWCTPDGQILISEPPAGDRWKTEDLAVLGVRRIPSDRSIAQFRRM